MGSNAFCVHGHFYQPPREDPFTGIIPKEKGAAPYRNWNERIFEQCYRPNAELGNFRNMSFNIGPTLNSWIEQYRPELLDQIVEQDHYNLRCHGVGNAMAQSYNHTILPLSSRVDKETQIRWGIEEFRCRYGHDPIGMWLPETAMDQETLEVLAECGIEFTILAPWQAEKDHLDVSKPYLVDLPGGNQISVFFYAQDLSMRVSFDPGATINGDRFVLNYLEPKYKMPHHNSSDPQIYIIASDGELYGHHQRFRDKFLAYLLDGAVEKRNIQHTYPALWLKEHPAKEKIKVRPNTSWSCHHGVSRWKEACGCAPNGEWKFHLRNAFDRIAEGIDKQYLLVIGSYLKEPWELRHGYIKVLCGKMSPEEWINSCINKPLSSEELDRIALLLKAQYERQRMFTSCGWFFDDFDRIEPRNNVAYAAQAILYTCQATGVDLTQSALEWLRPVKSWRSNMRADWVFEEHIKRAGENL